MDSLVGKLRSSSRDIGEKNAKQIYEWFHNTRFVSDEMNVPKIKRKTRRILWCAKVLWQVIYSHYDRNIEKGGWFISQAGGQEEKRTSLDDKVIWLNITINRHILL